MARKPRPDHLDARHHVMNRGTARRNVFDTDADRTRFLTCLDDAVAETAVRVESYCLMGNHFHLSLWCPDGGLSATMQHVSANYTRWYNSVRDTDGPIFRSRFASVLIASDRQLLAVTRYIHRNPLDLGRDPLTFPWSSYQEYTGERVAHNWLSAEVPLQLAGGRHGHAALVRADDPLDDQLSAYGPEWEPRDLRTLLQDSSEPALTQIQDAVARCGQRAPARTQRSAALLLATELTSASSTQIATGLGFSSPAAARMALRRARSCAVDSQLGELVAAARVVVGQNVTTGV